MQHSMIQFEKLNKLIDEITELADKIKPKINKPGNLWTEEDFEIIRKIQKKSEEMQNEWKRIVENYNQ
jgi:ribosomal protein S10